MEANVGALQITPHRCTSATSGCDGNGCALNTQSITNGYGSGSSFTINTQNSFLVSITFTETSSQLASITSVISQGTKSITLTHSSSNCGSGYLQGMTTAFQTGMVPVWSVWSGSMSWLDAPACSSSASCSTADFIVSGFTVSGAGTVTPPPPPTPVSKSDCGDTGCTITTTWVEFLPPTSFTGTASSASASVLCSGSSGTPTYPCSWYAAGSKYQCNPSPTVCTNPIPIFQGAQCPYPTPQALVSDQSASSDSLGLSTGAIAGIAVGCVVLVVGLIVVVVVLLVKRTHTEEYV